jgi:hypothetical protein
MSSSRWGLGLSAVLALLPALGCHPLNINPLRKEHNEKQADRPAPGGPPASPSAYSFRIAPYVFLSDFEIERDQPLFRELARLRDQVHKELLLPGGTAEVRVYLFETKERYERYMKCQYPQLPTRRAFFIAGPRAVGGGEELLVWTYWGERIRQDLRHELTHALLHSVIKDVPLWLDEGLAEYFELPPERAGTNAAHLEQLQAARAGAYRPDLARLEGLKEVEQMSPAEYREAWAWVNLMLRSRPEAKTVLLSYLQQLRGARAPGPLRPLLAKVFPSPEEALRQHLDRLEWEQRLAQRAEARP